MSQCIFCKLAAKEIPSTFLFEDEEIFAFRDISPQAPTHILAVPKKHIATLNDVTDFGLIGRMAKVLQNLAGKEGIDKKGFRVVINCNQEGGQSVYHLHMHLLGGRQLGGGMAG